jgi:hypothetical protein
LPCDPGIPAVKGYKEARMAYMAKGRTPGVLFGRKFLSSYIFYEEKGSTKGYWFFLLVITDKIGEDHYSHPLLR